MITIERDDDGGYWRIIEEGIGIAKSKSRNCCVRIRDALNALNEHGLVGLTVQWESDLGRYKPTGVVVAIDAGHLLIRSWDGFLLRKHAVECRIIEPERPEKETPNDDPAIGVLPAVDLLKRFLTIANVLDEPGLADIIADTTRFLRVREAAELVP